jgi:hypothetical protein
LVVELSSQEFKKRRLQYLYTEHQLTLEEYYKLHKSIDGTTKNGYLHAILGDAQTSIFAMQQMNARLREVVSDLHRLDYEIGKLNLINLIRFPQKVLFAITVDNRMIVMLFLQGLRKENLI